MFLPLPFVIVSWRVLPLLLAIVDFLVFTLLGQRTIQLALLVLRGRVPLRLVTQRTPFGERSLIAEYFRWYFAGLASAGALAYAAIVDPEVAFKPGWQTISVLVPLLLGILGSFGFIRTMAKLGAQIFSSVQQHLHGAAEIGLPPGARFGVIDDEWVGIELPGQPGPAASEQQAMVLFQRAKECVESNNLDEAINLLREAIRLWPGNADLHDELALCYSRRGEHDSAIEESDRAIQLNPRVARFHTNLGARLLRRGHRDDLQRVEECVRMALEINPNFSSARRLRAALEERRRHG